MADRPANLWDRMYFLCQVVTLLIGSVTFLLFLQVPANPAVAFALMGSLIGYIAIGRSWLRFSLLVLLAAAYFLVYELGHGLFDQYPASWLAQPSAFFGLAAIVLTMLRWFRKAGDDSQLKKEVTLLAGVPVLCSLSVIALGVAMRLTPLTYDYGLYAFDYSLGSPSFVAGKWFATRPPVLFAVSAAVYNMLPLWISLTWICLVIRGGQQSYQRRLALIVVGAVGFALYQLCPAAGPAYRFAGIFPFSTPDPSTLATGAVRLETGARNAMPSLHISWMLIICVAALRFHWIWRLAAAIIAFLTLAAMLGSGEHYFIDAVVALPLVAGVLALTARTLPWVVRLSVCAGSSIVILAWLLAFRTGVVLALSADGRVLATLGTALIGTAAIVVVCRAFQAELQQNPESERRQQSVTVQPTAAVR